MSRGGTSKQNQSYSQSQKVGDTAQAAQNSLAATLTPMYTQEATNPTASPVYQAENTAGQQSTGGSVAAVKGAAGLRGMRTGNRGADQIVMDESVRNAMRQNSQNSMTSVADTANRGVAGLQGLYGSNVQELLGSMGIGSQIANNQASQPGWFQNMTSLIGSLAGAGAKTASGGFTL